MALIKCAKCGREISDKAKACPNCGRAVAMASAWYYSQEGRQCGPVSAKQLKELVATGHLHPTDWIWKNGWGAWVEASKVQSLFTSDQSAAPPASLPVMSSSIAVSDGGSHRKPPSDCPEFWARKASQSPPPPSPNVLPSAPAADSSPRKDENFILSTLHAVQGFICAFTGLKPLTDFKLLYLFSDVLKRRSPADVDAYFNCGCARTTPEINEIPTEWPRPWFFARMLLFGVLTTLGFWLGFAWFEPALFTF
jgi:hypothetical protein